MIDNDVPEATTPVSETGPKPSTGPRVEDILNRKPSKPIWPSGQGHAEIDAPKFRGWQVFSL